MKDKIYGLFLRVEVSRKRMRPNGAEAKGRLGASVTGTEAAKKIKARGEIGEKVTPSYVAANPMPEQCPAELRAHA